jgi:Protein of unknown function (DUF1681)
MHYRKYMVYDILSLRPHVAACDESCSRTVGPKDFFCADLDASCSTMSEEQDNKHADTASSPDTSEVLFTASEVPLLTIREVFVYAVPPLKASSGHRAEEWGLEKPVFTGSMKIAQADDRYVKQSAASQSCSMCTIHVLTKRLISQLHLHIIYLRSKHFAFVRCLLRLYQPPKEGELGGLPVLFAVCPVKLGDGRYMQHYVEHVMDSSRYFVLRCEVSKPDCNELQHTIDKYQCAAELCCSLHYSKCCISDGSTRRL